MTNGASVRAPGVRPGPRERAGTGLKNPHYKWIALSNTTIGILMAVVAHGPEWSVPVVQDDLEACQEPPPKDRLLAFIFQVPDMELPDTEPE